MRGDQFGMLHGLVASGNNRMYRLLIASWLYVAVAADVEAGYVVPVATSRVYTSW